MQVIHLLNSPLSGFGSTESAYINNDIDQGIEMSDRLAVTYFWSLDTKRLGLTIDAFTGGALSVEVFVECALSI